MAGLNLGSSVASLAAAAVFGCGLGQVLSATNLWVAEVARTRRVAALSILNLMWGLGAIASSPLVMLAERRGATALLFYAIAVGALFTALLLTGMDLEPGTTEEEEQRGPAPWMTSEQLYDRVMADPANKAIVARAFKRPTASSTSGDELQR